MEGFFGVGAGQGDGGHAGTLTPEQALAMLSGDGGAGEEWADASVDDLDLPTYVHSILTGYGIETIGALLDATSEELLSISGFGQKSLEEVRNRLADRSLTLKGEEADEAEAVLSSDVGDDYEMSVPEETQED
jgi:DNA-directed RNA polymerase alpha subunit